MNDVDVRRTYATTYDHEPSPYACPEVKAALKALNEKRATGWRPETRTDWGEPPGERDFLGQPIDHSAAPATTDPIPSRNDEWLAARKAEEAANSANPFGATTMTEPTMHPHPQRRPTRPDHVISAMATANDCGAPVWRLCIRTDHTSDYTNFHDGDPVLAPVLAPLLVERNRYYAVDLTVEWNHDEHAWPTARSVKENKGMPTKAATKDPVIDKVNAMHDAATANHPPTDYDTFDQPGVLQPLPWGDDNLLRGTFFARYKKEVWGPRACPDDRAEAIRKAVLVREYGVDTLKGFSADVEGLLAKLTKAVENEYPLAMAYFDEQAEKEQRKDPPSSPDQTPSAQTGSTEPENNRKPIAPTSTNNQGHSAQEVSEDDMPLRVPHHYEPEFVVLFEMFDPDGKLERFTIKADDEFTGYRRKVAFQKFLRGEGYTALGKPASAAPPAVVAPSAAQAPGVPPVSSAPAPVPSPAASSGGVYVVREIQKIVMDNKTRYELYDQPGASKPVLTVRPAQMVKRLLAPHINVDALQPGTRYSVNWRCEWTPGKMNDNSNTPFKDLSVVQPLAAA